LIVENSSGNKILIELTTLILQHNSFHSPNNYRMKFTSISPRQLIFVTFIVTGLYSCVPAKKFEDLTHREKECQDENATLRNSNHSLLTENTELKASDAEKQRNLDRLVKDTTEMGNGYSRLTTLYNELSKSYDKLLSNNEKLLAGNSEETKKLILELSKTREDLQKWEDRMIKDSLALIERENNLNQLKEDLKVKQARVDELESVLKSVDSTVNKLKTAVSKALMGYENNGLSVFQKEGRVYVSMEEQLLFASGSTNIEKKGENALKELSHVLAGNKDINIVVEGHTDNVPISGTLPSGARDNWELSVLRATSVVKIILNDKAIDPTRLTASGRGPFRPVDSANTTEARKKNRRTEIILSPKLDDLAKLLGQFGDSK
jgi:chemotaxis protein MotB